MNWLEIIEIRAAGTQREIVESQLQNLIDEINKEPNLLNIKIYWNAVLESDFSIHLVHDSQISETGCSTLCTRLVSSLKDYGLVNHTVWIEKLRRGDNYETKKCK